MRRHTHESIGCRSAYGKHDFRRTTLIYICIHSSALEILIFFHSEHCEILHIPLTMTKLHMRAATLADIPRLAEIWAIAFLDDSFYNAIFPRRSEFMADYRAMWTRKLQKRFLGLGEWYIVVEVDVVDAGGQSRREIAGWASWKRMGSSKAAEKITADNESFLKGVCEVGRVECPPGRKDGLC